MSEQVGREQRGRGSALSSGSWAQPQFVSQAPSESTFLLAVILWMPENRDQLPSVLACSWLHTPHFRSPGPRSHRDGLMPGGAGQREKLPQLFF